MVGLESLLLEEFQIRLGLEWFDFSFAFNCFNKVKGWIFSIADYPADAALGDSRIAACHRGHFDWIIEYVGGFIQADSVCLGILSTD